MPTIRRSLEEDVEFLPSVEEPLKTTPENLIGHYLQTTPAPSGPESAELSRIMADVRHSLEQLITIYPFLGTAYDPMLVMHGYSREADETLFDYEPLPPAQTTLTNTKFSVRGRGKPRLYPLEDE